MKKLKVVGGGALVLLLAGGLVVFGTGDLGATQFLLTRMENRALHHNMSFLDRWLLKGAYQGMRIYGSNRYPQATELLRHYCEGTGDTLFLDAKQLLANPEVQAAVASHKKAITFRAQPTSKASSYYAVRHTNWPLYYAFDLLFIKRKPGKVAFYDAYDFLPLERRSYTPFRFGKIAFRLNDGLVRVAYPHAKAFIAYGETASHAY